jgi:HEAT repeat protein
MRSKTMKDSDITPLTSPERQRRGVTRRWRCGLVFASALTLLVGSPLRAQPDPVVAYQDALENHLDNKTREKTLQKFADEIKKLGDLSRAIRYRESARLTDLKQDDEGTPRLRDSDKIVFLGLLRRFVKEFKEAVKKAVKKAADPEQQVALATLAGKQGSGMPVEYRSLVHQAIENDLLPELENMARSTNKEVQLAVARAVSQIVFDLKENLLFPARARVRSIIIYFLEKSDPAVYNAIIEGADNLVKLYSPAPGEEPVVPKLVDSAELIDLLALVPIYSRALADSNAEVRKRAVAALTRFTLLMVQNRLVLRQLPLPPTRPDKPDKKQEEDYQTDRKLYRLQLDRYRQGFAALAALAEPLQKVIADPDPEVATRALRAVEDLAVVQTYIRDHKLVLPKEDSAEEKKSEEKQPAPPAGEQFLEPALEKLQPAVLEALTSTNPTVRLGAVQVLERREPVPRAAAGALVERLGDSSLFVRWAAARVLGHFKGQEIEGMVSGLGKLLLDRDLSVRLAAASTLETLGRTAKDAVPALIDASTRGDPEVREAILKALGAVGPGADPEQRKEAVHVLARQLSDPDYRVRRSSATALGRFPSADIADAESALKQALSDEDGEVRRYATEALLNR